MADHVATYSEIKVMAELRVILKKVRIRCPTCRKLCHVDQGGYIKQHTVSGRVCGRTDMHVSFLPECDYL